MLFSLVFSATFKKMNRIQIFINALLIAAVSFLTYQLYQCKRICQRPEGMPVISSSGSSPAIVYLSTDSLLEQYPYYEQLKKDFEKKHDSLDKVMSSKMKALENEIKTYQENAPAMTEEQRQKEEERLYRKQQDFGKMRQALLDELGEEEDKIMNNIYKDLSEVLKEYNKTRRYHFILGYQKGSGILLANDSLDITREIIEAVNAKK
jgi:outer membrane protein